MECGWPSSPPLFQCRIASALPSRPGARGGCGRDMGDAWAASARETERDRVVGGGGGGGGGGAGGERTIIIVFVPRILILTRSIL
eukprot:8414309-Pyramimonas_sp.AAC.1